MRLSLHRGDKDMPNFKTFTSEESFREFMKTKMRYEAYYVKQALEAMLKKNISGYERIRYTMMLEIASEHMGWK